jgi:hypothetical protein
MTSKLLKIFKKDNLYLELRNLYFKLNKRVFKKGKYKFSNMIKTDRISCGILFVKVDNNRRPLTKT